MKPSTRTFLIVALHLIAALILAAFALRGTGLPTRLRMSALKLASIPRPGPALVIPDKVNICPATRLLEEFSESRLLSACDEGNSQFKSLYSGELYRWVPNTGIYYNDYLVRVQNSAYSLTGWQGTGRLVLFLDGSLVKTWLEIDGMDEQVPDGAYGSPSYGTFDTGVVVNAADQAVSFFLHDYNKDLKIDRPMVGWIDPYDFLGRMKCGILGQAGGRDIQDFEQWAHHTARELGGVIQRRTCWTDSNEGGYDFDFNDLVIYFVLLPVK